MNIQNLMKELFGHSCLGYVYAFIALNLKTIDAKKLTKAFLSGWFDGYIEDDGFVAKPVGYLNSLGLKCKDITKVKISKLSELPDGIYAVEYLQPNGKDSHFVVANKNGVIFDPSEPSLSVKQNKILSYRKIIV